MTFRHLTLLAIAVLVLVLGAGFLANQRWVARNLRYEAAEAERKRQSDPLVLFGSSLTEVAVDAPRAVRGIVYVPSYASIRAGDGRSRLDLATTLSIHRPGPRMQSSACTRSSSAGSRPKPCCPQLKQLPCCSGRCSLRARLR